MDKVKCVLRSEDQNGKVVQRGNVDLIHAGPDDDLVFGQFTHPQGASPLLASTHYLELPDGKEVEIRIERWGEPSYFRVKRTEWEKAWESPPTQGK